MKLLKKHENGERSTGIKIAGGLVCQYYDRIIDQCTRYGHPLLLAARHLIALMVKPVTETYRIQSRNRFFPTLFGINR